MKSFNCFVISISTAASFFLNIFASFSCELNLIDSFPVNNKSLIKTELFPASLFLSGAIIAGVPGVKQLEQSVFNGFKIGRKKTNADDYLQYTPALAVFAADALGLKGKNKPNQQLLMYGLSNVGTAVIVQSMKRIIGRERPDGSNKRSFPSGHTSTAFVAAEFLHQEFGRQSNWISFAGYAAASATGYLRMYNNAHWLGDVIAGAAIGLGTTKLIYWIKDSRIRKMKRIGVSHL